MTPTLNPNVQAWLEIIKAMGPILTAFVASAIGYLGWQVAKGQRDIAARQKDIAEAKLKHDLFDRRFAVYQAASDFLHAVVWRDSDALTLDDLYRDEHSLGGRFQKVIHQAPFLFGSDVTTLLFEIEPKAFMVKAVYSPPTDKRETEQEEARRLEKLKEFKRGLSADLYKLEETFMPYLKLSE